MGFGIQHHVMEMRVCAAVFHEGIYVKEYMEYIARKPPHTHSDVI